MKQMLVTALGALCLFTVSVAPAFAKYPERNVTMIVPYAAGGTTDIIARALAGPLSKSMGVTVVIKNTTGAGGIIGAAELAKAKPDGYTIGYMPIGPVTLQQYQRKLPYQHDSFEYIGLVYDYPMMLLSGKHLWTDFKSMEADVKANPGKFLYGSSGVGAMPHLASAYIFREMGADVRHLPSTDSASVFAAIAGGTAHFYSDMGGLARVQELRPLAVAANKREPLFPDVPTMQELGYDVPEILVWNGIMTPKGISPEIKAILDAAVATAVTSPEFQEAASKLDFTPHHLNATDFDAYTRNATVIMQGIMTELGFTKQ